MKNEHKARIKCNMFIFSYNDDGGERRPQKKETRKRAKARQLPRVLVACG